MPAPPLVDIADDTYLRVPPPVLARLVADSGWWIRWWPDLVPHVTRDRGVKGQQWTVTGALRGSMEVWLEPVAPGTVVHWYLRADPTRARVARSPRRSGGSASGGSATGSPTCTPSRTVSSAPTPPE